MLEEEFIRQALLTTIYDFTKLIYKVFHPFGNDIDYLFAIFILINLIYWVGYALDVYDL